MEKRTARTHKAALKSMPFLVLALLIGCDFGRHAKGAILYWDTDGAFQNFIASVILFQSVPEASSDVW